MRMLSWIAMAVACAACATTGSKKSPDEEGLVWVSTAFPTGHRSTSAVLVERGAPREVPIGEPYDYEIRVTNLTDQQLEEVMVYEEVGQGLKLESSTPPPTSSGEGTVRWMLGSLAPGATQRIMVRAVPGVTGDLATTCEVSYRPVVRAMTTVVRPQLVLEKTDTIDQNLVGEPVELHFTVSNPGSGAAREVVITNELPEGMETMEGERVIRVDVGRLEAGAQRDIVVRARALTPGSYELKAAAAGAGGLASQTSPTTLTVLEPKLVLERAGPDEWILNRDLHYGLTVRNDGTGQARDVVVELPLPPGIAFVAASDEGVRQEGAIAWQLGTLEPGAARTLDATIRVMAAGSVTTRAVARASWTDEVAAEMATRIVGVPALRLEVVDREDPVGVGGTAVYEIRVANQGSAAAEEIGIACELEQDAMEYQEVSGATRAAREDGRVITLTPLERLEPGQEATWTLRVKAAKAGDVRLKVVLTSNQLERSVEESEATRFYQ